MARLGPISRLFGFLSHDIAIDLGTANTLVMVRGRGIVIIEPSIVAIDRTSKRILAIGEEAQRMVGRTPANIVAVRPLRDGVISDFEVTERMLSYFIRAVQDRSFLAQPRVVVGIPSGVTEVEKRAVHDGWAPAAGRAATIAPLARRATGGARAWESPGPYSRRCHDRRRGRSRQRNSCRNPVSRLNRMRFESWKLRAPR